MELINERTLVRTVAKRFANQYGNDRLETRTRLQGLNKETATAEDVKKIIGNSCWTAVPGCGECGERTSEVVIIGEELEYDSATAYLCRSCIEKALTLFCK